MRKIAIGAALLGCVLLSLFLAPGALAAQNPFCLPGAAAGQCNNPQGLATDFESGDVYVADKGNNQVDVFEPDGDWMEAIGAGQLISPTWVAVDNDEASASRHDIWATTSSADFLVKKFKANGAYVEADSFGEPSKQGSGACEFKAHDPIAVGPGGKVYVANSYDKDGPGGAHVFVNRVIVFAPTGRTCLEEMTLFEGVFETIRNFAVDSTGHIYGTVAGAGGVIRKHSPTGTLEHQFEVLETEGIAVDEDDNLYAKQRVERAAGPGSIPGLLFAFTQYAPSTAILKRFDYTIGPSFNVPALSVYREGPAPAELHLYSSEGSAGVRNRTLPPPGPVIVPELCRVKGGAGNISATLQAEVNPEGKATTFKFEYLTEEEFDEEGGFIGAQSSPEVSLDSGATDFELHEAALKVEGLIGESEYRCRVVAKNADGEATGPEGSFKTEPSFKFGGAWTIGVGASTATVFVEGNPLGIPATGQIEYVTDAQYQANPGNRFAEAQSAPTPELDFGASEEMQVRSATLTALIPGTLYHYRLRARNGLPPEGIVCPELLEECPELEHTFRTHSGEGNADGRRPELVSPGQKNSAEVGAPGNRSGFVEPRTITIQGGATDGESITYTSWTSFGDAESAPATSQYLSKRTAGGWATENISPFGFLNNLFFPPYSGFSPDLRFGAFKTTEPALTPDCRKSEGIYLRDNLTGALRCLDPEVSGGPEAACLVYGGASGDGSRAFVAGKPEGGEDFTYSLYEWSAEGGMQLVSILPSGEEAPATQGNAFGPGGGRGVGVGIENCQVTRTTLRHAISADGSRAFWTFVPEARDATVDFEEPGVRTLTIGNAGGGTFTLTFHSQTTTPIAFDAGAATIQASLQSLSEIGAGNVEVTGSGPFTITFKGPLAGTTDSLSANAAGLSNKPSQLLVRVNGTKTEHLDKKRSGGTGEGNGVFWGANSEGSIAYFTSEEKLIAGAKADVGEPDLYRYEVGRASPLVDITAGGSGPGDVKGVTAISDDGSHVYFVAGGVLAPGGVEGANNLYLFNEGTTRFIASLANQDEGNWSSSPREMSARVSPDGRYLAFVSIEAEELAGYDNRIASGEHCKYASGGPEGATTLSGSPLCSQVFVYDSATEELTCASCNPAGSRPLGPTIVPGWTNGFEGPRFLSNDGGRTFFQSFDALQPADTNGKLDVYGFERAGKGSCDAANLSFDPFTGGCHFLVSGGKSTDESYFLDASSDGRDIFFSTRQPLVGWDLNENFDVYDFREGGGFPEPPVPPVPCAGLSGCRSAGTSPPSPPNPATPSFNGPGNEKPKKAKKKHKKSKKHNKKKGQKKKGGKGKKKPASKTRRASR